MTLQELTTYFATKELPKTVQLYPHAKIVDVRKFVEAHLGYCGLKFKKLENCYFLRLVDLKNLLEHGKEN